MPEMDGVEATRRLRERWPKARVIIPSTFDDDEYVFEGLRAGALGYLLKDVSINDLAEAIQTVMAGGVLIEPSVARKVVAEFSRLAPATAGTPGSLLEPLTERERNPGADRFRLHQPGDRYPTPPGGRHRQELRHQHPGQDRRPRSHPGSVASEGTGIAVNRSWQNAGAQITAHNAQFTIHNLYSGRNYRVLLHISNATHMLC